MDRLLLENDFLRLAVAPQGAAILSLESLEHQQPILHPGEQAMFPMLPLANRVAENRFPLHDDIVELPKSPVDERFFLHGDGWMRRWQVASGDSHQLVLTLRSRHDCGFDYQARLSYRLEGRRFFAELELTHVGAQPMVYGLGMHPFFHLTPETRVQFGATGFWPEGELHLPQAWQGVLTPQTDFTELKVPENQWLNVGYSGWSGKALIDSGTIQVQLSSGSPYLMVFRMADEPFICLEPQSHPVNAHNMPGQPGLVLLGEGETTRLAMDITVS
ncbi:aldose 1-epimerase [Enterobacteriaceae bacterium H16N7]|nr:aldose 1-epimerase [Dryocola clanedunensis]